MLDTLYKTFLDTGNAVATTWILVFVVVTILMALSRIFIRIRQLKIQKRKYLLSTFRHEIFWSAANIGIATITLTQFSAWLVERGYLQTNPEPASWYVVIFEFALYFFIFDFYFYWVHRAIHVEPIYKWIHKTHHFSVTPNPLSSSSMNPIEGVMEGLIVPSFLALITVHESSTYLIIPFATLMGLYVHCGFEFMPAWWYKNPLTNWFITPMFHDQHHQFFRCNYGAYTTIWDRVFGTVRPRFHQDFDTLKAGSRRVQPNPI